MNVRSRLERLERLPWQGPQGPTWSMEQLAEGAERLLAYRGDDTQTLARQGRVRELLDIAAARMRG
jgi:hypothetical protein